MNRNTSVKRHTWPRYLMVLAVGMAIGGATNVTGTAGLVLCLGVVLIVAATFALIWAEA